MNRPTPNRPNISQPGFERPNTDRPGFDRPIDKGVNIPGIQDGNRPDFSRPNIRPNPGFDRPAFADPGFPRPSNNDLKDFLNLPGTPPSTGTRPAPGNRPGTGDRPGIGDRPAPGDRPGIGDRPAPGDRPGVGDRPAPGDRPGIGDRPAPGDRPGIGDRPAPGDRPGIGDRPAPGDRPGVGDRPNRPDRPNIGGGDRNNINVNIDRSKNINNIRNKWTNIDRDRRPFNPNWWDGNRYHNNPNWHWHNHWNHYPPGWCWRPASWVAFGTWFTWGAWSQPYTYDYGSTVVYRDNYVYVDNQQYASADQYYQQAVNIADSVPQNVDDAKIEWMPLGVFAISEESATDTGMMIQLAVSKEGIIAGTFYNDITGSDRPLEGMVDQKTQRAAWKFADDKDQDIVMETGIYNLTKDEATALVHYDQDKTQTWLLIRLPEPKQDEAQEAPATPQ
ncbi:hypothetical protein C5Y97_16540 [Blastopirellula marina]|uniref:Mu-protocadherin-putative cell-suface protein n=2 Tax=Blastopirellula marina TaxID=124 RepID=A0A2S8FNS9_9BACT|nr:hypothetical protein C5Y98_16530 [Blastopirellula marina]PTL43620.1 hypothetical protein C5Y97_16540 [Blastopirellula marina]